MRKAELIVLRYHILKDVIARGTIMVININASDNVEDFFTKQRDKNLLPKFRKLLSIKEIGADAQQKCWKPVLF